MIHKLITSAKYIVLAFFSLNANAALIGVLPATINGTDYQAYYDDVANLTWLADANAAQTNGFDGDGRMNWNTATNWAAGLNVAGVEGWRLPDSDACIGRNCSGSVMGNLFYNTLGNLSGNLSNTGPFSNIQLSTQYWSATVGPDEGRPGERFVFGMKDGSQGAVGSGFTRYAWAIHTGNVSAVPIPAAVWLFGSGLIALMGLARNKKLY